MTFIKAKGRVRRVLILKPDHIPHPEYLNCVLCHSIGYRVLTRHGTRRVRMATRERCIKIPLAKIDEDILALYQKAKDLPNNECSLSDKIDKLFFPLNTRLKKAADNFFKARERLAKLGPWPFQFDKEKLVPAVEKYRREVEHLLPGYQEGIKKGKILRAFKEYGAKTGRTIEQLFLDVKAIEVFTKGLEDNRWFDKTLFEIEMAIEKGERKGWFCDANYLGFLRLF